MSSNFSRVKDQARARELAAKLDQLNTDRQEEEKRILRAVEERFASDPALSRSLLHRHGRRRLASRRHRHYCDQNRRTLQPSHAGYFARWSRSHGSGRSIRAFHLLEAVESCGHFSRAMADTLTPADLPCRLRIFAELRTRLDQFARTKLTLADFEPVLDVDADLL